jgi:hypothetical protein
MEEHVCIDGSRSVWLGKVKVALETGGFSKVAVNDVLFQVTADYKKFTVWARCLSRSCLSAEAILKPK